MASSTQPRRRLGQTAQVFAYGHLLQTLPSKETRPTRPEPEWNAPPIDSSDESTSSPLKASGSPDLSEAELPATKKSALSGLRVPRLEPGRLSDDDGEASGHIKPTTFTSRRQNTRQGGYGSGQKRSRDPFEDGEGERDPFGMLSSSQPSQGQSKRVQTYKSRNIHGSAPSLKRTKSVKKTEEPVVKKAQNGFRVFDAEAALAKRMNPQYTPTANTDLRTVDGLPEKSEGNGWKEPPKLSGAKSSPARGTRRSSRNQPLPEKPAAEFHMPPAVPTRLNSAPNGKKDVAFMVPPTLPSTQPTKPATFKIPACLHRFAEIVDITSPSKESLNRQSTTSSYPSLAANTSSSTSSLSSPPSSPLLIAPSPSADILPPLSLPSNLLSLCPVCQVSVPASVLQDFTATYTASKPSSRLTVRQQAHFCRTHRTASAQETWHSRGYPTIDWAGLPTRLSKHHDLILSIIKNTTPKPSYYRTVFYQKVATGINRTALQAFTRMDEDGCAEMGYYGSKGAGIMMEYLIEHFKRPLRRLAQDDKVVVAGGGVSGFVQRVLVPELVVRLVGEDMGVGEAEEARRIVGESAELGALLCEEEEEVVEGEEEEGVGYGE
ncbi:hypothetical protein MMC30_000238 [Trapelia coarctata]|nr:hypothetical protein [Trapelia coarctata]